MIPLSEETKRMVKLFFKGLGIFALVILLVNIFQFWIIPLVLNLFWKFKALLVLYDLIAEPKYAFFALSILIVFYWKIYISLCYFIDLIVKWIIKLIPRKTAIKHGDEK